MNSMMKAIRSHFGITEKERDIYDLENGSHALHTLDKEATMYRPPVH